jgi:hypothetical protein
VPFLKKINFDVYEFMNFCLLPLCDKYLNVFFLYEFLDSSRQSSHGDIVGRNDAPTPQHPSTIHIPRRIFYSLSAAQTIETYGAHETPPPHMLDCACNGLQGESHEDDPTLHCYPRESCVKSTQTISLVFFSG